jgi:hypothetical protein
MTTFIHEPDGEGEPTIWVVNSEDASSYWPRQSALLRRVDIAPHQHLWDELVERITGWQPCPECGKREPHEHVYGAITGEKP